jgi:hypothetical protein
LEKEEIWPECPVLGAGDERALMPGLLNGRWFPSWPMRFKSHKVSTTALQVSSFSMYAFVGGGPAGVALLQPSVGIRILPVVFGLPT